MSFLEKYKAEVLDELEKEYKEVSVDYIQSDLLDDSLSEVEFVKQTLEKIILSEERPLLTLKQLFEKYHVLQNTYDTAKYVFHLSTENLDENIVEKAIDYLAIEF
ncbi:TPA: hypothetical protein IWN98_001249 [Enterococcus faecium]|uniref:Uncharacterized protein n=3 Tax=Enterococcus TaxID=1350 RepID=A0A286Q5P6_ENTAV|nr:MULTISPECIES: hypothetical protein [Enterococcus]APB62578.1 hypothetical protein pEA19081_p82 [Enterococcus avium]APB62415.1 hypothetical protein pEMA120_p04 [Enterococcus faecium]EOF89086.1 hypothetical protein SKG_02758 [Enterococcus faecium EnGen0166]EOH43464.1 hypothetical protein SSI_02919 [Enterococcus faecium EnGen0191]EOM18381.1 hypothetical protein SSM_03021 [Enterococcus faecium EnGen0192]